MSRSEVIFIPDELDDYGLTRYEFRVYCTIARWGDCTESVSRIARRCRMRKRTVRLALRLLVLANLIEEETKPGGATIRRLTATGEWVQRIELDHLRLRIEYEAGNRKIDSIVRRSRSLRR